MKANILQIRTPEGITFSLTLASPFIRFLAWTIDLACILTLILGCQVLITLITSLNADIARAVTILFYFLFSIGYGITTEWFWRGQTLGKRVLKLRVMDNQVLPLQFNQIVIRNLFRFVDSLPLFYLVGGVASLISKHYQRLGDFAANTIVVRNPEYVEPDLDQLLAGKYNSLRQYPHLIARLRKQVTAPEATLALQALFRREEFEPHARLQLYHDMAWYFRSKVEFPPEVLEGITDEQYIRNLVDVLYRAAK